MSGGGNPSGLSGDARTRLMDRLRRADGTPSPQPQSVAAEEDFENWQQMEVVRAASAELGIQNPFFQLHEGIAGAQTRIDGRMLLNFASYNYLDLNGHPRVTAAAIAAMEKYGTSGSGSRLMAGERPVHRALETALADLHGTEDCISLVSGHATNVTVIGCLLNKADLILCDAFSHNSILQGAQLSGARRFSFAHNDVAAAERLLAQHRAQHKRALLVIEGHYSMDGDIPDLPAFIALARKYRAWLMVDEAHSVGILGRQGRGIAEHFGIDPTQVDFWMGTLSKTLAGCGGYIACRHAAAEYLRYHASGSVYSVSMPPPMAAASLAALEIMLDEPQRIAMLNANTAHFLKQAKSAGLDTGTSQGFAIVPVILGSSILAARLSEALLERGINARPIIYPAVPERTARLRFFLSSAHETAQIDQAVAILGEEVEKIRAKEAGRAAVVAAPR